MTNWVFYVLHKHMLALYHRLWCFAFQVTHRHCRKISLVRDLKMLWRAIEPNHPNLRMKTQAAKNKWVDAVCLALAMPGLVRCLPRSEERRVGKEC